MMCIAFISLILVGWELYTIRQEVQGAFDRSLRIASDDKQYLETVDLPIDETTAFTVFKYFIAGNLSLNENTLTALTDQKIRNIVIDDFQILNVFTPTSIEITNPLTGEIMRGSIDRPSIAVLAHVEVKVIFLPTSINIPIFAVSTDWLPI